MDKRSVKIYFTTELTNEIVRRFNSVYDNVLVEPKILLPDNAACLRLPGTDGKAKMSKSLGNCIYLSDTEEEVKKKAILTDTFPGLKNNLLEDLDGIDFNTHRETHNIMKYISFLIYTL